VAPGRIVTHDEDYSQLNVVNEYIRLLGSKSSSIVSNDKRKS